MESPGIFGIVLTGSISYYFVGKRQRDRMGYTEENGAERRPVKEG